jgi:Xaa-Pro aminopeptidase
MASIERTPPEFPVATTPAPGVQGVDWEQRVDFERLRRYRLERARHALEASDLGALLVFDTANIRYLTATHIGYWAFNKMERWALLTRTGEPWIWDFGSAARVHKLQAPWLDPTHSVGGNTGLAGSIGPESGLVARAVGEIRNVLEDEGVASMPLGVDMAETEMFLELTRAGIDLRNGQQVMLRAREIKSQDEIILLSQAAAMVDGVYQDIFEALKPGIRESDIVALANKRLYEMGSEHVEAINSIAGERCSPHPHVFSDRLIRPGDTAYFDIVQACNGYRTCYYRTLGVGRATAAQRDAYKRAREWIDAAIALVKPGTGTDEIAQVWPDAQEFGFPDEMEAFGLQFGHGVGLSVHERPVISRLNSLDTPIELEEGMFFALETYCPAADGRSAARIEEEVICTTEGPLVVTLFPAEELLVANEY